MQVNIQYRIHGSYGQSNSQSQLIESIPSRELTYSRRVSYVGNRKIIFQSTFKKGFLLVSRRVIPNASPDTKSTGSLVHHQADFRYVQRVWYDSLPETNSKAPETLGLVQMNLLVGFGLLAGAMLVSGRAIQYNVQNLLQKPQYSFQYIINCKDIHNSFNWKLYLLLPLDCSGELLITSQQYCKSWVPK